MKHERFMSHVASAAASLLSGRRVGASLAAPMGRSTRSFATAPRVGSVAAAPRAAASAVSSRRVASAPHLEMMSAAAPHRVASAPHPGMMSAAAPHRVASAVAAAVASALPRHLQASEPELEDLHWDLASRVASRSMELLAERVSQSVLKHLGDDFVEQLSLEIVAQLASPADEAGPDAELPVHELRLDDKPLQEKAGSSAPAQGRY